MCSSDLFRGKKAANSDEANTLFGQTALGNNVIYQAGQKPPTASTQILYVTTASTTSAGRPVDMSVLTRNSTVMSCVNIKARDADIGNRYVRLVARAMQQRIGRVLLSCIKEGVANTAFQLIFNQNSLRGEFSPIRRGAGDIVVAISHPASGAILYQIFIRGVKQARAQHGVARDFVINASFEALILFRLQGGRAIAAEALEE